MKTDYQIANEVEMKHITEIASDLGIEEKDLEFYGKYKAKLSLDLINEEKIKKSNLILVSAITPTPAGEGKTTVSIGLAQAMNKLSKKTTVVLREPSLGPVFGIKGGATGGGYSQVVPMEDINLHFTGDMSAVEKSHNLLAALVDNELQKESKFKLDHRTIAWRRVTDMNDRSLRKIVTGLGGRTSGIPRETGFDITAASEVMAALCLAENFEDLKKRLGNIFIGYTFYQEPVWARDLEAHGAMTALLKDAIKPNLVQTLEHTPAIIHGGPFANIAQGTNSVIATKMGLSLSDYVVTEAGFGCDLGAEKFLDIKCQSAGLNPKAVVLVATIRALKLHGGVKLKNLKEENLEALEKGLENLEKHLENIGKFNLKAVVALNKFPTDTEAEIKIVKEFVESIKAKFVLTEIWEKGGDGGLELAKEVLEIVDNNKEKYQPIYEWEWDIKRKIETVAKEIYGADGVEYTADAKKDLRLIKKLKLEHLPICMAKTQKSLSDNPKLLGRPRNFKITVREIQVSAGAGFVVPITGEMMRMPGLPDIPAAQKIDIDLEGNISGLF